MSESNEAEFSGLSSLLLYSLHSYPNDRRWSWISLTGDSPSRRCELCLQTGSSAQARYLVSSLDYCVRVRLFVERPPRSSVEGRAESLTTSGYFLLDLWRLSPLCWICAAGSPRSNVRLVPGRLCRTNQFSSVSSADTSLE